MDQEEIVQEFTDFLDEMGLFYEFKNWAQIRGYSLEDFGMTEEDDDE